MSELAISPLWLFYAIPGALVWHYVYNGSRGSLVAGFLFGLVWPVILTAAVWAASRQLRPH